MYCRNCGKKMDDKAIVCPSCGFSANGESRVLPSNAVAIVGFVFSFLIAIVGLICSIVGYLRAPMCYGRCRRLSLAGIIISVLSIVITFCILTALTETIFGSH